MNIRSTITTLILCLFASTLSIFLYHKNFATKTAYIDIKKVFNGFKMKAELEEKYKQTEKQRTKILDSLSFNLKIMSKHLNDQRQNKKEVSKEELYQFEYSRDEFIKTKEQFQQDNANLSTKLDQQILTQLTQYVIEFGKKHNYDVILGADGNGSLMYSKDALNISDKVILFINGKYNGIE